LGEYSQIVRYLKINPAEPSAQIRDAWDNLALIANNSNQKKAGVNPLISSKWDQGQFYNTLCPMDNSLNQRTVTGCVATAMAMVLKYWNYPAKGTGFHSYNHPQYGTLSANFASTTYNWTSMPNYVTSSNNAVATLMYHCGVSVDMNYGVSSTGGSGAYVISSQSPITHCTEYALKTYFGYKNTLQGLERKNYTDAQWLNLLKTELDAQRPIIYAGFGGGGGHCFLVDGYDNSNKLHINWGWSGSYDGYFNLNAFSPDGLGTGGGTGEYTSGHQAVIGIQPNAVNPSNSDLRQYSSLTVNPTSVGFNQGFTVSAQVGNFATQPGSAFNGEIGAAIFNSANQFVEFIEIKNSVTINPNIYQTFSFSTQGISVLTPGTYSVSLFSKKTGTNQWDAIGNGQYSNVANLTIIGNTNATLKLYAGIVINPASPIQRQSLTVNFDVLNTSNSTFNGEISIDLHGSDGKWIRELGNKGSLSLPANYHYTGGLSYSITNGLPEEPGSYQLFVWYKPNNGDWEQVAGGDFSNPINFQLRAPGLSPDIYEPNNSEVTARQLTPSFVQNSAKLVSVGSNCHIGNDYDYYKLTLPIGFKYTISPRLQDSYNANNGKDYTLDALFSYSVNGDVWSDTYDDILESPITIDGPVNFLFKVSPYFTGEVGTYDLDITITRTTANSVHEEVYNSVLFYPNPAKDLLHLRCDDSIKLESIFLYDLTGKLVKEYSGLQNKNAIELKGIVPGMYVLLVQSPNGFLSQKLTVEP